MATPLKTRPDLTDDQHWLVWLDQQPENKELDVHGLYRKMLTWCEQRQNQPTRRRLLKWLETERENIPMTYKPPYHETAAETPPAAFEPPKPCEFCGKELCLSLHRDERGI